MNTPNNENPPLEQAPSETPALRHTPFLDTATEGAIRLLGIPPEETGFIDTKDLALWLEETAEVNMASKGLFWAALQWNLKANPSTRDPSRDTQAQVMLDRIKAGLPSRQLASSSILVYEASLKAMYLYSQNSRAQDDESTVFVDVLMTANDMLARTDLGARSKWNYRSALLWHIDMLPNPTERDLQAKQLLISPGIIDTKPKRNQGNVVPEKDLDKILAYLEAKARKSQKGIANSTLIWIRAGLATGLRPVEWIDATWANPEKSVLRVICAKQKIGQTGFIEETGEVAFDRLVEQPLHVRNIGLHSESDSQAVDCMIRLISEKVPLHLARATRLKLLLDLYHGVKQKIYRTSRNLFDDKRIYSLYSFRRQFAANAKAAYGTAAAAEMMGHSGQETPSAGHYGKGNQAHARFKAKSGAMKNVMAQKDVSRNLPA